MSDEMSIASLRNEMIRLTRILVRLQEKYIAREAEVIEQHADDVAAGKKPGALLTVLNNDVLLNSHGGASKTVATLAGALAQVISAEIEYQRLTGFAAPEPPPGSRTRSRARQAQREPTLATGSAAAPREERTDA